MHTFLVTFNDGSTEEFRSEQVQFAPTHIMFNITQNVLGYGDTRLVAAPRADTVLVIEEIDQREDAPC